MSEIDDIRSLLEQGFRAFMILREPTQKEIARLPGEYAPSIVRALPMWHPDGRKMMYYIKDPDAIAFAQQLVGSLWKIVGREVVVYVCGIGNSTVHGMTLELRAVAKNLQTLLNWQSRTSEYPNTIEINFRIEGDDVATMESRLDDVRRVALALSLRNRHGFAIGSVSSGVMYLGQQSPIKCGIPVGIAKGLGQSHLTYLDNILQDEDRAEAALALQTIYSQVTDDARLTVGWAAIEHIFSSPADHLLTSAELTEILTAVNDLLHIPSPKRERILELLRNPDLISAVGRNERMARSISERTGEEFNSVYRKVKSLASERGRRVHTLLPQERRLREHVAFVEEALWRVAESGLDGPNVFREETT
jgi:hypothetical protein